MTDLLRLHVTPLNPSLLPVVLPSHIKAKAVDVTFHEICTFPERNYGFISLPVAEANNLKKKFHNSVVRGNKMKVENARPKKGGVVQDDEPRKVGGKSRSKQSQIKDGGTVSAIELPKDRKVKRGWTEPQSEPAIESKILGKGKSRKGSKNPKSLSGVAECLFVTNVAPTTPNTARSNRVGPPKRKRDGTSKEVVVHEFERTRQFPVAVDENKGDSDRDEANAQIGVAENVNVSDTAKKRRARYNVRSVGTERNFSTTKQAYTDKMGQSTDEDETSSSGSSGADPEEDGSPTQEQVVSADSHEREALSSKQGLDVTSIEADPTQVHRVARLSITRSSDSPEPHIDIQNTSAPTSEVHPLEALFKRPKAAASQSQTPKKPHLELSTSFGFFDRDTEANASEDTNMLMPQTPFTQQDYRYRRQRSAAPTPDTALPGKTFSDFLGTSDGDDAEFEEDTHEEEQAKSSAMKGAAEDTGRGDPQDRKQESENAKWFWEHRGENNRAWKRRRKEATKEKRLRDRREKKA